MLRTRRQPSDYVTCMHCHRDFRAITVRHLRNIHSYDGDHPIEDYKRRFNLETTMCEEVRQKLSESKEVFWARKGKHWTRQKLIDEIRKRRRAGKSLRGKDVPVRLYLAARRLYGGWQIAVEKAGINYAKATGIYGWTPEKVVEEIQKLAGKGIPLNATYVQEHHSALFNAAAKKFPRSWRKALRAAGFDPDEHRKPRGKWTEEKAKDWVKKRLAKKSSVLSRDAPQDLHQFVRTHLGKSWTEFIESLGIPYPGVKKRRDWTKAKVLSEIRAWKRQGNRMNYRAIQQDYQALLHQARKFYGSWDRACAAAGV